MREAASPTPLLIVSGRAGGDTRSVNNFLSTEPEATTTSMTQHIISISVPIVAQFLFTESINHTTTTKNAYQLLQQDEHCLGNRAKRVYYFMP
eukprot:899354-Pyramimonas_sp.AAC.1